MREPRAEPFAHSLQDAEDRAVWVTWGYGARVIERAVLKASRTMVRRLTRVESRPDMIRLGSGYGGWWVPADMLGPDSVCYLAGLGEDASFDLALVERFGCHVWAIDPTPRAIEFASTIDHSRFHFLPFGLWDRDADVRFYEPRDPQHVSHSIVNAQRTDRYFTATCRTLTSLMTSQGHTRIDLLKLDIEGAEVAVIDDLVRNGPRPRVLLVELDAPESPRKTLRRLRRLTSAGYVCRKIEDRNYTFTYN